MAKVRKTNHLVWLTCSFRPAWSSESRFHLANRLGSIRGYIPHSRWQLEFAKCPLSTDCEHSESTAERRVANTLTIAVEASSEADDHQARLLIDGKDWLGPAYAGLDPPMLKTELLDKGVGTLIVGRCWTGLVGCHDVHVEVTRTESSVHWSGSGATSLRFNAAQYDAEVTRFAQDTSRETVGRAVEREVEHLFRGTTIRGGFEFDWASTRIREGLVHLSFRKGHRQRLLKFSWDGASVAGAIDRARVFRAERFAHCE